MNNKTKAFITGIHERTHEEDFRTPEYIVKWLKYNFGEDFYDACYNENYDNALSTPYIPGKTEPNQGEWVYFNPPFHSNKIPYFIELAKELQLKNIMSVFLLPNKLCQVGFVNNVNRSFDEIIFLGGRINFDSIYSTPGGTSKNGCFIGIVKPLSKIKHYATYRSINLSQIKKAFR